MSKFIEQFGSGFKRINSLCNDAGIKYSYENRENGFKLIIYRPELQSDIPSVTFEVTLSGTEMAVLAILKQKPDSSFPCRGAMPLPLQEVNRKIFSEWLPASIYEIAEGYNIEYYSDPENFTNGMQDTEYYAEVWIPVKEK